MLDDPKALFAHRIRAGVALFTRGHASVLDRVLAAAKDRSPEALAAVAPELALLPERESADLLGRVLAAPSTGARTAACRAIGRQASGELRQAVAEAVRSSLPGTEPWFACTIARARLNEPDAVVSLLGLSSHLEGRALLDATDTMLSLSDDRGLDLARKITRVSGGVVQIQAAERLAHADPAYVTKLADAKLEDPDPAVRSAVLILEQRLSRTPGSAVRAKLIDTDEMVRLRAAEAVLTWADRQRGGGL